MEPERDEFDPLTGEITDLLCGCIIVEMPKDNFIFVDMEHCVCGHFTVSATFDDDNFNDGYGLEDDSSWPDQGSAQALP